MINGSCLHVSSTICAVVVLILSGCARSDPEPDSSHNSRESRATLAIDTTRVLSRKLVREAELPGDLFAYRDVGIYPKVAGFIDWIGVDRGSSVNKGQLLIKMSAPEMTDKAKEAEATASAVEMEEIKAEKELAVIRQQFRASQAKSEASSVTYRRLKEASSYPGIIPGNDLDIAEKTAQADTATVKSLERKCEALESQLGATSKRRTAALHDASSGKVMESYLRLTAPFDGMITERNVHEGSYVSPPSTDSGRPLLRLQQLSILRLTVPIPESVIGDIRPGSSIEFAVSAYPRARFSGVVSRIADSVDINTRTMAVELDVRNSDRRLRPGMFAQVRWPLRRAEPSLFVPQSALVRTTERIFVIRVRNGIVDWVDVKPGVSSDDLIEIFGNLSAGDEVVARGTDELREGTTVSIQRGNAREIGR